MYNKSKKIVTYEDDNLQNEERDIALLIVSKEYVERVEEFIYSLDNIYKEVILLKAQYNYSINEIAGILKINPKTVQKRLERGRVKIKNFLSKEGKYYE